MNNCRQDYRKLYGKTQEQIYITMRSQGYDEKFIQRTYKIPQASLRRCRRLMKAHLWNNGY